MKILVLNAGSSTYKLSYFEGRDDSDLLNCLWKGKLDWGSGVCVLSAEMGGNVVKDTLSKPDIKLGLKELVQTLWNGPTKVIGDLHEIECIGHRIVHGGSIFLGPVQVDNHVKEEIRKLIPLAPLHNPINLEGIELMEQLFPAVPQIAVFDTSFHLTMTEEVKTYPIPFKWKKRGIQRYGFHGISHQYCAEQVQRRFMLDIPSFKMINCHLGNGSSLCAIQDGKSADTTMGMTPMEGLMMGTRSGSIDPGIMLYLMREENFSNADLDKLLNFESGLKGICDLSDMREIRVSEDPLSKLAVDMFTYRLKFFIGALTAVLNGVDVLCFTGGIGENDALMRETVCGGLGYLGIVLDKQKNLICRGDQDISGFGSKVKVVVVNTQEEWMIARACEKKNNPNTQFRFETGGHHP
jgi:acetate kinase